MTGWARCVWFLRPYLTSSIFEKLGVAIVSFSQTDLQFLFSIMRVATLTWSTSGLKLMTALTRSGFITKMVQLENEMSDLSSFSVVFKISVDFLQLFWIVFKA